MRLVLRWIFFHWIATTTATGCTRLLPCALKIGGQYRCEESYGEKFPKRVTRCRRLPRGSDMLSRGKEAVGAAAVRARAVIGNHRRHRWAPPISMASARQTDWPVVSLDKVDILGRGKLSQRSGLGKAIPHSLRLVLSFSSKHTSAQEVIIGKSRMWDERGLMGVKCVHISDTSHLTQKKQ